MKLNTFALISTGIYVAVVGIAAATVPSDYLGAVLVLAVIAGILLEIHQFVVNPGEEIPGFDEEVLEQVFHSLKIAHRPLPGKPPDPKQCQVASQ